jgi:cullin-associated NEDD8-dissociated protein 1
MVSRFQVASGLVAEAELFSIGYDSLALLSRLVKEKQLQVILDKLVEYISSKEEELRDIASLGLKTVMAEIPADSTLAARAGSNLTPKLLSQIADVSTGVTTFHELYLFMKLIYSFFIPSQPAAKRFSRSAD